MVANKDKNCFEVDDTERYNNQQTVKRRWVVFVTCGTLQIAFIIAGAGLSGAFRRRLFPPETPEGGLRSGTIFLTSQGGACRVLSALSGSWHTHNTHYQAKTRHDTAHASCTCLRSLTSNNNQHSQRSITWRNILKLIFMKMLTENLFQA